MLLINTSNNPIETIFRWWRHSPLFFFFSKPQKHHNKQTNKQKEQLPEKQTKLTKREIKQTQNKLQIELKTFKLPAV
jgi:hypothetical protein